MIFKTLFLAASLTFGLPVNLSCSVQEGFNLGLAGEEKPQECNDRSYRIDFELGRNIRQLRSERAELESALLRRAEESTGKTSQRQTNRRLQVVVRELNQLEGLARIRGLLDPTT